MNGRIICIVHIWSLVLLFILRLISACLPYSSSMRYYTFSMHSKHFEAIDIYINNTMCICKCLNDLNVADCIITNCSKRFYLSVTYVLSSVVLSLSCCIHSTQIVFSNISFRRHFAFFPSFFQNFILQCVHSNRVN